MCRSPEKVRAEICSAAERSVRSQGGDRQVSLPESPVLNMTFHRASHADMAELIPGARRVSGREVEWAGGDMNELYRVYRAMATLAASAM